MAGDFLGPMSMGNSPFMKKQKQCVFLLSKNDCGSSIICTRLQFSLRFMVYEAHLNTNSFILQNNLWLSNNNN